MSSEDGGSSSTTYQKQTQTSAGPLSSGMNGSTRKRSSHYSNSSSSQQQQQQHSQHYKENLDRSSKGCNTGDYITTHDDLHHHQLGTNYNSNASPSRYYSSTDNYILGNRLSTVSQEK